MSNPCTVQFRIDKELRQEIRDRARLEHKSQNDILIAAIRHYFEVRSKGGLTQIPGAKEKIKGLSKEESQVLNQIAIGKGTNHPCHTCRKLKSLGLIEQAGMVAIGKDAFGEIMVPDYYMPMSVHIDWCELMSDDFIVG